MRDTDIFIDDHPLKGGKIIIGEQEYIIGKIYRVLHSRRLYIQLLRGSIEVNFPLHEIAKILFDEGPHSIS
jgi:hypothetical protein